MNTNILILKIATAIALLAAAVGAFYLATHWSDS